MSNQIIAEASIDINEAPRQAENAQKTANDAKDLAGTADNNIKNINDPNYLSPFEKPQLEIQMANFATIYAADKNIAISEGIDFSAYDASYQAYVAYMTPLIADMTTYSPIVRSTFNSMVTAVQVEQKRFNTATQAQYSQQINKAQTDIDDGQTKYKALQSDAETIKSSVAGVADTANRAISSAGFASDAASAASQVASSAVATANEAAAGVTVAKSDASSAVTKAESTASAFGKVDQKADSAVASALNAQSAASSAVSQASSAAADSKDAKQIAGAVSQSYKTLIDGSTMTIAELQNGLAAKLTKTDLNGYATQDWAQNQIKLTADGINGTISSIKGTVDGHTTSINTLQTDSNGFKDQFTKVNNTIDQHTTDIGTLQADAKSLSSNFDSFNTDINGKLTTLQGSFDLSSKQLSTTMSKVDSNIVDFNNLTISNRNLALGTAMAFKMTGNGSENNSAYMYHLSSTIAKGTTVTVSFDITSTNSAGYYGVQFVNSSWQAVSYNVPLFSGTQHKSYTLVTNADYSDGVNLRLDNSTSDVTISNFIISESSKEVSWSPAPEDLATVTALTQVKQTADSVQVLATNNQGDIAKLQVTAKGLQSTVSDKVSSDQLTQLSNQLTNKISDLSSSTDSAFTQTSRDINGLVKKGDVVNQFNLDAGGALLSTSGNSTKIVFSAPNIIFDSANPVQIPNVNIPGTLTGKTFEAGEITATTKITGADIEAPLIHSPSGSFKLDGDKGSIMGATITSTDNSWSISPTGKITGVDVYAGGQFTYNDITGTTYTGSLYSELNSSGFHQWSDKDEHVRINKGYMLITNKDDEAANSHITGINGTYISRDSSQFAGGVVIYDTLKVGNLYTNGAHTINSVDGGGIYFEDGIGTSNSMVDIYTGNINATGTIQTGNIAIGNSHSITMNDGANAGTMYFSDSSGSQSYALKAKSFSQSSLLSLKTDITAIDPHDALTELIKNDFMSYHYKTDNTNDPKTVSVILDDINPIPEYYTSDIFKSADGTGRNDGNVVGYLGLSVKDLNSREIADKAKIAELETRLQKLEGAN